MPTINYEHIIDISLPLSADMVVYPGTPPIELTPTKSTATGSLLTKITFSSHTGTHIDAPSHVIAGGDSLDEAFVLKNFIGPCRVIDFSLLQGSIDVESVKKINPQPKERLLFKTSNSRRGFKEFYEDFVYLAPEAAAFLAQVGAGLVGIDSWSIKQKGSPDNTPHTALLSKNIPIVEGLNLSHASGGSYFLLLLPLRFVQMDGAPARAVLLTP